MVRKTAAEHFHGPDGYNCAQAVLKTFQQIHNIDESLIVEYKKNGGGRAQGGLCGALYSVKKIVDQQTYDRIETDFIKMAGSNICRQIKKLNKISCRQCVAAAAGLLDEIKNNEAQNN